MNLEITQIISPAQLEQERVVLLVSEDMNIGRALLLKARKTQDGGVAGGRIDGAYWIPDKQVKAKDLVVVYTKAGTKSEKANPDGTTSHFFYWGLAAPCWTVGTVPVVVDSGLWKRLKA
jgi:hypothetical protein